MNFSERLSRMKPVSEKKEPDVLLIEDKKKQKKSSLLRTLFGKQTSF